jgi:hypothetical protein
VIDLRAQLAAAESVVDSALDSSGCTVHLRRPRDPLGDAVDPVTLLPVDSTQAPYASNVPALVAEKSAGGDGQPGRPGVAQGATVVLKEDAADVQERDEVVVATSRDPRLVGREYAVAGVRRTAAGIVMVIDAATPVRRP